MKYILLAKAVINKVLDKAVGPLEMAILGIVVISTLSYALAWQAPGGNPPVGNTDSPLNTGSTGQAKSGGLILNTGGAATGLIVQSGYVGIGTASPTGLLDLTTTGGNRPSLELTNTYTGNGDIIKSYYIDVSNNGCQGNKLIFGYTAGADTSPSNVCAGGTYLMTIAPNGNATITGTVTIGSPSYTGENEIRGNLRLIGADQSGVPSDCRLVPQNLSCAPGWVDITPGQSKHLCVRCY